MTRSRRRTLLGAAITIWGVLALAARPAGAEPKHIIMLVGLPGAGKTTGMQRLAARLGAEQFISSEVIRETLRARGQEINAQSMDVVSKEFAGKPGTIGRRQADLVAASSAEIALIDGFRNVSDLVAFKAVYPQTKVIAIEVGQARRFARLLERKREGEDSVSYLRRRDRRESGQGVRTLMRMADVRVRPSGTLEALDRSLDRAVRTLLRK